MDLARRVALLRRSTQAAPVPPRSESAQSVQPLGAHATPASIAPPPSITDRLARNGRAPSAQSRRVDDEALAVMLGGRCIDEGLIEIDTSVALPSPHGRFPLARPDALALPYERTARATSADELLFLDTETTGLAGGTGTLPFLVGLARFEDATLRVRQYFLTGFHAEAAMLAALRAWIHPRARIVSFNGKSFDAPLLATRYRLARMEDPWAALAHTDLLHPTRNAFRRQWQDCRLQTAETQLLGLHRDDDLPGHLIPYAWFNFVRSRDPGEVARILAHNHWDVRSLAALLLALEDVYADPGRARADALGVARSHRRNGADHEAIRVLAAGSDTLDEPAMLELAALHRRRGEWQQATALWRKLDDGDCVAATQALAVYFEHRQRDLHAALNYADKLACKHPHDPSHTARRERLRRKLSRKSGTGSGAPDHA